MTTEHFTAERPTDGLAAPTPLRARITTTCRIDEAEALAPLLQSARLPAPAAHAAHALAHRLASTLRRRPAATGRAGLVQGLLQEYALSSQEGVALMCLAEALLRIPDAATRDALIRDKIAGGHWQAHAGRSPSVFVNAATWGLLLTGKLVATHSEAGLSATLARLIGKGGEPLIRKGVDLAMRMMGEQFVSGETIDEALARARDAEARGFRHSYDMLGEAALTAADAQRYRRAYEAAIHAIGRASAGRGVYAGPGISIKLSALHPRYVRAQHARVAGELYPVLCELALLARRYDIGLNIDAEEADRLELSLDLLEALCAEPGLAGWHGIGFVVQAYQKRCPAVVDFVVDLARRTGHRLMVRLVKGAYWDSEIKRAQVDGLAGYPVFTRKAHTDVSYLACARRLLDAADAVYPQFATHNAHTLAAIHQMAGPSSGAPHRYEFQCLHGMGEPLYDQVVGDVAAGGLGVPCRIYAPVGTHETLLAYLVRRLLENGANTSFVNRIGDASVDIEALVEDPVETVGRLARQEGAAGLPHSAIPLPVHLYGDARSNSLGLDLASDDVLRALQAEWDASGSRVWDAMPTALDAVDRPPRAMHNPADHRDLVGHVRDATSADVDAALAVAQAAAPDWAATPPAERAGALERAADSLEAALLPCIVLLAREAGKTAANGVSEVREAVDFLRYYAAQVRVDFDPATHRPLGPVVCISPWNFPLAIFVGQVAAALAAGNPVLAKPAEQTPLVAAEAVRQLHAAGIPRSVLQLLPGPGETVGAALVADARVQGVMFTGSTAVARTLQKTLAERLGADGRPVPLIAETGGQNAMIVDSSALAEQVVADVMASAFDSAGQRCSALRVLCMQDDVADRIVTMLEGAMAECRIGDPALLEVDVGPVIDDEARQAIERHVAAMQAADRRVRRLGRLRGNGKFDGATLAEDELTMARGSFVVPTLIEIEHLSELTHEVFGPVLHLLRFRRRDLGALVEQIDATGYGLTLGLHTRIDETIEHVVGQARAGNIYVNRNMVGAVVGVQPFGGEGLSGTGPKAGGPLYLFRLLSARPDDASARGRGGMALAQSRTEATTATTATTANAERPANAARPAKAATGAIGATGATIAPPPWPPALHALHAWARAQRRLSLAERCEAFAASARRAVSTTTLAGPTGERNVYTLRPRDAVLCLAADDDDRLLQLAAVLAVGSRAVWPQTADSTRLREALPAELRATIVLAPDGAAGAVDFDVALHQGDAASLLAAQRRLAARPGAIVNLHALAPGAGDLRIESLLVERSVSINVAAAGGNSQLMTIG